MLALAQAPSAGAHAALVSSEPASNAFLRQPPGEVRLVFAEPVDSRSSTIEILDAAGKALATGPVQLSGATMTVTLPALDAGIYNVVWANVSRVDGHAIRGSFPFTVLNADGSLPDQVNTVSGFASDPDAPPRADGVAVRALALLGLLMVAAGAIVTFIWQRPPSAVGRAMAVSMAAGAGVAGVATLLNLQTLRDAYAGLPLREVIFETQSGGYWIARIGVVALVGVLCTFVGDMPRRASAAIGASVAVYLWAFTATSHAAASTGSGWARMIDFTHGVAAVAWIGAVLGLLLAARSAPRGTAWASIMSRFSLLASTMVFVLLATGLLGALVQVDATAKLTDTRYGVTLLVKLALMVPLLGVAAYNARRGKLRLTGRTADGARTFMAAAGIEVALGLAVFTAAAFLTQTTAAKSIASENAGRPFDMEATFDGLNVRLQVDPNRTGLNTYRVEVSAGEDAVPDVQRVRLTFRYQEDQTVGAGTLTLTTAAPGIFVGQGPYMTLEGRWRVEAEVRRPDANDVVAFFDVRPAGTPVQTAAGLGTWDLPTPGLSWNEFGGIVLVLAGLGFALGRGALRSFRKRAGWLANSGAMLGFGFGALLLFGVHAHEEPGTLPSNPIVPDTDSIARGRELYQQNCLRCHGQTGTPPEGLDLNPYPLDLTVHVPQHPDGTLYNFIADGVPGTAMVAWRNAGLSDEEIWHLVNFLRTFTPADR